MMSLYNYSTSRGKVEAMLLCTVCMMVIILCLRCLVMVARRVYDAVCRCVQQQYECHMKQHETSNGHIGTGVDNQ